MKRMFMLMLFAGLSATVAFGQNVTKENVAGIQNLNRIETTIACAGAITPGSVAEIKKMGFVAVFNLREASEPGNDIDAEAAAAKAAGVNFISLPFNGSKPDPMVVDKFLKAIVEKGNQPAFIHCAGGNRAAAMWFIKRALVDKWDIEKAMAEATALGFSSAPLKAFAIDYVEKHKK